jgi:hypothetical protein
MASPPVEGDSVSSTVPGVTGTNSSPSAGVIVLGAPQPTGESAAVLGNSQYGVGVHGISGEGSEAGPNTGGSGVFGEHTGGGNGVYGTSVSGNAVAGKSTTGNAGWFENTQTGNGVQGTTSDSNSSGVIGVNNVGGNGVYGTSVSGNAVAGKSTTGNAGWFESSGAGVGVYAESQTGNGVQGITSNSNMSGVIGVNNVGGNGVYGTSVSGNAVAGKSTKGNAGWFDGPVYVNGNVDVTGDVVLSAVSASGGDCAEEFEVTGTADIEPGTVMVLDQNGALRSSQQAYDKRVAGVISGAGDYKPGLILDRKESSEGRVPIALIGKVYCKVDAQYVAIEVGDLLTTSPTPGHAMKAADPLKAFGTVIGKALRPLEGGQGLIPILVALQ